MKLYLVIQQYGNDTNVVFVSPDKDKADYQHQKFEEEETNKSGFESFSVKEVEEDTVLPLSDKRMVCSYCRLNEANKAFGNPWDALSHYCSEACVEADMGATNED